MGFLRKFYGMTLCNEVHSGEIHKTWNVEPLLRIKRSQLLWFSYVSRMSQERLARQVLLAAQTGKQPRGRQRTRWCDYISVLAWFHLGVEPAELQGIAENRDVQYFETS